MRFSQTVSDNLGIRALQWLFFAAFVAFGFGWVGPGQEFTKASRLSDTPHRADGIITTVRPGDFLNAPSVNYDYSVDGKQYGQFARISPEQVTKLQPGDHLSVIYASGDPNVSAVNLDAERESAKHSLLIVLVLELIVALFFWGPVLFGMLSTGSLNLPAGNQLAGIVMVFIMLTVGLSALFFVAIPQYSKACALIEHGKPIRGVVTSVYDDDGRYADYAYTIDGSHYTGRMKYSGGYADRPTVTITYLPDDPGFSAIHPDDLRSNSIGGVLFLCLWNALVGGIFAFVLKKTLAG